MTDHGIYASGNCHDTTLRRNIWWRIAGGAIHAYSGGEGIDAPARITIEYNIIGPDKLGRCWGGAYEHPYNDRSAGIYLYGGKRWAGCNRVVRNLIFGGHARGITVARSSHFNLIAHNTILDIDEYTIQTHLTMGDLIANNIMEPGRKGFYWCWDSTQWLQADHNVFLSPPAGRVRLWTFNAERQGEERVETLDALRAAKPQLEQHGRAVDQDPFVGRGNMDFRLKADSPCVDAGSPLHILSAKAVGAGPDAGALEVGEEMKDKFPVIPQWLLDEWPLSKRREQEKILREKYWKK